MGETTNLKGFFYAINSSYCWSDFFLPGSSWKWKIVGELKGNKPIGDTPILHWTMMMGRRVDSKKDLCSSSKRPTKHGVVMCSLSTPKIRFVNCRSEKWSWAFRRRFIYQTARLWRLVLNFLLRLRSVNFRFVKRGVIILPTQIMHN